MKLVAALALLVVAVHGYAYGVSYSDVVHEEWAAFKMIHRKTYESVIEEKFRMKIYMDNKRKIAIHNQNYALGLVTYDLSMNKYGDMLHSEFVATMNGYNGVKTKNHEGVTFISPANVELPSHVDWRDYGAVTPVKDQGACGSCWAFSSTGCLEGQHFRKTGVLVSLSEQNLVDCSTAYGNNGCQGGIMENSYRYIKDNAGIDTENTYPYEGREEMCRYNSQNSGATDAGYVDIPSGREDKLLEAVATIGPISVAIDASHSSFQFYHSGIYYESQCSTEVSHLDHAVLVVGYGTDEHDGDYWLVKNSWDVVWGIDGYLKMSRNKSNNCGIATLASYPLV